MKQAAETEENVMHKIGIMGGTFDPIHIGHIRLGVEAQRQFGLERVLFMPTGIPAYKAALKKVTAGVHRAAMTELAVRDYEGLELSEIELIREGNTYTADTLTQLCEEHPENEYYYIVGADSLDYMDRWYHPEVIFAKAVVLAAGRNTQTEESFLETRRFLEEKYQADIRILQVEETPISSSEIRAGLEAGADMSEWIDEDVLAYIQEQGLYRSVTEEN